jgi:hypothetical protein
MRVDDATDVAAIAVFEAARETGQPVTMQLVRDVLDRMADRDAADKARPTAMLFQTRVWQSSIAASRRKALR